MINLAFFSLYFAITLLSMFAGRMLFSKTISLLNLKKRVFSVCKKAALFSFALIVPFLNVSSTDEILYIRFQLILACIALGLLVQYTQFKQKVSEYQRVDREFAMADVEDSI